MSAVARGHAFFPGGTAADLTTEEVSSSATEPGADYFEHWHVLRDTLRKVLRSVLRVRRVSHVCKLTNSPFVRTPDRCHN